MKPTLFILDTIPLTNLLDLKRYEPIININLAANFHHFGNVLVIKPEDLITAVFLVSIIQGYLDHIAFDQLHLSRATLLIKEQKRLFFPQLVFR